MQPAAKIAVAHVLSPPPYCATGTEISVEANILSYRIGMLMYEPTALSLAVASDSALEQPGCDQSKPKQGCATAVLPASHPPSDRGRLDDVQLCHALVVHATVHCKVVWHSLTALISRPQLALSQPGSLQGLLVCVVGCMDGLCRASSKKDGVFRESTPRTLYIIQPTVCNTPLLRGGPSGGRRDRPCSSGERIEASPAP